MHVLVTCKYKKGQIKSQWGLSVAMDTRVFIQSTSNQYAAFTHPSVMLHIKFEQDWPTGLRYIQVRKCKIFVIQGQIIPKLVD